MESPTTILRELSEGKVARGGLKSGQKKRLEKGCQKKVVRKRLSGHWS